MRPVSIANRYPSLRFKPVEVERAIHELDERHGKLATSDSVLGNDGELSIVFMSDTALAELHARFLDDPTITDVITFEGDPAFGTAGEICVSVDAARRHLTGKATLRRSAIDQEAFSRELTLYVIHGWLHLAGYDDLKPVKKRIMRRAEKRAMDLLAKSNALPIFRLK